MKNHRAFTDSKRRPGQPERVFINLTPETEDEKKLLRENNDRETIETYYQQAVQEIGGENEEYAMLGVVDTTQWPFAAQVNVQRIGGLGE